MTPGGWLEEKCVYWKVSVGLHVFDTQYGMMMDLIAFVQNCLYTGFNSSLLY